MRAVRAFQAAGGRVLVALVVVTGTLVIAGCGATAVGENSIVNGWSIGPEASCGADCAEVIAVATERLSGRDPGHPPILGTTIHAEGLYPNRDGDLGQIFRSGMAGFSGVVLFHVADGSYRAVGYGRLPPHLGDKLITFDFGPERRPGRTEPHQPPAATP
jgi:hypothetical protein